MSSRLIAIGDIHGCHSALSALLEAIGPCDADQIVTLGDYIDRGPDSKGVINELIALKKQCRLTTILGNHEEMLLATLAGKAPKHWWLGHGGRETLASYGLGDDHLDQFPGEHREWIEACPAYEEAENHFFTHANYVAGEPLACQPAEALRWQSLAEHFPLPHCSGKIAVVGHTPQRAGDPLDHEWLKCLDTNCWDDGWLTAMDLLSGKIWQASNKGVLRTRG